VNRTSQSPQEQRFGRLKYGSPSGDFTKAPRCGAKTRRGTRCECPAMPNGRCRLHGGRSSGAKTKEGLERIKRAVTKSGMYTKEAKELRAAFRRLMKSGRDLLAHLSCNGSVT